MLKAVIFDMDGVIVNSEPLHRLAYKKMFEEFQLDVSNSLYESFTGQSTYSICKQLCDIFNLNKDPNELVLSKRKHFKVIFEGDSSFQMIDGAMNLIENYFNNDLTLILDPPREGMHKDVINEILKLNTQRIVYVSCNPSTQCRDLELLKEKYSINMVQPVDMFPHTDHVENIVLLELK